MSHRMNGRVLEAGNGLPDVGAYVSDGTALYRVLAKGRIQTGGSGSGSPNWMAAALEEVDWDACSEEDEFPARAILDSEGEPIDEDFEPPEQELPEEEP